MVARGRPGEAGYVLFAVLIALVILGIGLTAAGARWTQVLKREREAELVFRGEAIVRAIGMFASDRPGTLPETLDQLVEERYLRRVWTDPVARRPFFLVREAVTVEDEEPGILGVRSTSEELSLRPYQGARRYREWDFLFQPTSTSEEEE